MEQSQLDIVKKWASFFPSGSPQDFTALFTPDGEWIDHAFGLHRKGRGALEVHFARWIECVPNFTMELQRHWEVPEGVVATYHGRGTMEKDLPSLKAGGRPFEFQGVVWFRFRDGLIETVEETYTRAFQELPPLGSYNYVFKL
ncbi:hypothetical protein SLS56_003208 [Neofusicoccum ribis]|uniref:SnoaL-like domain-containing protein n=1 Tax=Neofusicoccum ribis TaxID=45134 RepID=A0ABR3T019_9PEZI